jgi:hypothetical protein
MSEAKEKTGCLAISRSWSTAIWFSTAAEAKKNASFWVLILKKIAGIARRAARDAQSDRKTAPRHGASDAAASESLLVDKMVCGSFPIPFLTVLARTNGTRNSRAKSTRFVFERHCQGAHAPGWSSAIASNGPEMLEIYRGPL